MPLTRSVLIAVSAMAMIPLGAHAADPERQAEVAARGAEVMPFELRATTHEFTKTPDGGMQQVTVKVASDREQLKKVRSHLIAIADSFRKGDFSGPLHIHGADMPGLAELRRAPVGAISIRYEEIADGGRITYSTRNPRLVAALHHWMDAQLSDHGPDAHEGHAHGPDHAAPPDPH